jgi:hypothetical protein
MSGSKAPERLESHLAMETSRSALDFTSGGSHLVRDQVEDLGEMPRSRYSFGEMPRDETLGEMPRDVTLGDMPRGRNPW